jgi:leader peptidase (prepilin peptidase) / N-methyltransferase
MVFYPVPAWLAPVLISPAAGSVIGVLVSRLPLGRPIVLARSQCDSCGKKLSIPDLVPIISYLALSGRCRSCAAPIAPCHLAVEVAAFAIAGWAASVELDPLTLWADCLLGWTLLALAWIDVRHMRLPDALTLSLVAMGILFEALIDPDRIASHVVGAIAGYVGFRAVACGYRVWRGQDGLGAGDAKLLAAAGAWVGWAGLPSVVFIAAFLGIIAVLLLRLMGRTIEANTPVPFGPYLALALWLVRLYGSSIFALDPSL